MLAAGYVVHRIGRRSGATRSETRLGLPGDELVPRPMWQSTRAITVEAPPADVWPWIVQMGYPSRRGGWYTPHWLDRLMWRIDRRSTDEIVPGLQQLEVGDVIPDSEDGSVFFTVALVRPDEALVLHSTRHLLKPIRSISFSWAFVVQPLGLATHQAHHSRTRRIRSLVGLADSSSWLSARATSSMRVRCCEESSAAPNGPRPSLNR